MHPLVCQRATLLCCLYVYMRHSSYKFSLSYVTVSVATKPSLFKWEEEFVQMERGFCSNGKRSLFKWKEEFVQMERVVCTDGKRSLYKWKEEFVQMER